MFRSYIVALVGLFSLGLSPAHAQSGSSAFSYQGRLNSSGSPASGPHDFQFGLYTAAAGGSQVGTSVTLTSVNVTGGLFSVSLDFGSSAFDGADNRWLQTAVKTGGGGSYTTLSPLTQVLPAPRAIYAASTDTASTATAASELVVPKVQEVVTAQTDTSIGAAPTSANSCWQSFTATETGQFSSLAVAFEDVGIQLPDIKVYAGTGTGGTLVANLPFEAFIGGRFTFTNGPTLSAGSIYTVELNLSSAFSIAQTTSDYAGGTNNLGTDYYCRAYVKKNSPTPIAWSPGSGKLTLDAKVGIGTVDPQATLHVAGMPGIDGVMFPDNSIQRTAFQGIANFASQATHAATADNATAADTATTATFAADASTLDGIDSTGLAAAGHTHNSLNSAGAGPANAVYADGVGNVGIGTSAPQAKLHISGTAGTDGMMFPDGTLQKSAADAVAWQTVTANAQMTAKSAYMVNANTTVTLALPSSANIGDRIRVVGVGTGGWAIAPYGSAIRSPTVPIGSETPILVPNAFPNPWTLVKMSASGANQHVLNALPSASGGGLYKSTDYGSNWTFTTHPGSDIKGLAISDDGSRIIYTTAINGGPNFRQILKGGSPTTQGGVVEALGACAISGNGQWAFVCDTTNNVIRKSATSSYSFSTVVSIGGGVTLNDIACSADGQVVAVANSGTTQYVSTNGGANWTTFNVNNAQSLAITSDGSSVFFGTAAGVSRWQSGSVSALYTGGSDWNSLAASANGGVIIAASSGGVVISRDAGATWNPLSVPAWRRVACSSDGTRITISSSSYIYTYGSAASGGIGGGQSTSIELLYLGNSTWLHIGGLGTLVAL